MDSNWVTIVFRAAAFLGGADLARDLRRALLRLQALGATLAHEQLPDAFEEIDGGVHSLGEKDVGL